MMKAKKSKIQTLKGFRDFLPEEALKRQWLDKKLRKIFKIWGYDPLETPTLEPLEIFEGEIGEEETLFYKFKDPGGRNVALRYDQTVPICRVVGQYLNQLTIPFKRYQIQPTFRAEKPQKGRYREFVQCDADILGSKSPYTDAEVIALSLDIYQRLGFKKAVVCINNRDLFKNLPYEALVAIDKIRKIGEKRVIEEMKKKKISDDKAKKYLKIVKNTEPDETLTIILNYLKEMGFKKGWYQFEPTITRSFFYSNGPIWEVNIPGFEAGSVIGGERYDRIAKNITGVDVPGTGFGLGFDRTLEAAEQFGLVPIVKTTSQVLVTIFSPEYSINSIKTTSMLRSSNKVNVELYPDPSIKFSKQLKYADKKGIPFVVILGPDEVKTNRATLKNMKTGEQNTLTVDQIVRKLTS